MAIEKQLIRIPMGAGVDTKSDPKLFDPPLLATLENCAFDETGNLRKRFGQRALETTNDPTTGHTIFASGNQLVQIGSTNVLYNASNQRWSVPLGFGGENQPVIIPNVVEEYSVNRQETTADDIDVAYANGFVVYAWRSATTLQAIVIEESTRNVVVSTKTLGTVISGAIVKCVTAGNSIWVIANTTGNTLTGFRLNTASLPLTWAAGGALATDFTGTSPRVDATESTSSKFHLVYRNTTNQVQLREKNEDGSPSQATTVAEDCQGALTIYQNSSDINDGLLYVLHAVGSGTTARVTIFNTNYTVAVATQNAIPQIGTSWTNSTIVRADNVTGVLLAVSATEDAGDNKHIRFATVTSSGTVGTIYTHYNLFLSAKAFHHSGRTYLLVSHVEGTTQTTEFPPAILAVFRFDFNTSVHLAVAARIGQDKYYPSGTSGLPQVYFRSTKAITAYLDLFSAPTGVEQEIGVNSVSIDFNPFPLKSEAIGSSKYLANGSGLLCFDGQAFYENSIQVGPYDLVATGTGGGANPPAGTYNYKAVLEWYDSNGNLHRSAPSAAATVTTAGAQSILVEYSLPDIHRRRWISNKMTVGLYRQASDLIYHRCGGVNAFITGGSKNGVYPIIDTNTDAQLLANEILYTEGDILPNEPTPACIDLVKHGPRLFFISSQDKNQIWYSKFLTDGIAPEFSSTLILQIEASGVEATGLSSLDDKLIVFTAGSVYVVTGDGPLDTGLQDTFSRPQKISSDVGCTERNSIVSGPFGVIFKSARGLYLLDRSLQINYIGAPVEDFSTSVIISGVLIPERNQVRFGLSGTENCLVWDFQRNQWSVFTAHDQVHACLWQGDYTRIKSDGSTHVEDSTTYLDGATGIIANIITAWVKLNGLAGFQRMSKARFIGASSSPHPSISVQVGYDYATAFTHTYSWSQGDISALSRFELEARLTRQKCEAVRFRISDGSLINAPWSLAELDLWVGVKMGVGKLPSAHRKSGS